MPEGRFEEITETGDPPTHAPGTCIEVMSDANDWEEMHEKCRLSREAGAKEVWVVEEDGTVRFFDDEKIEHPGIISGVSNEA
jgi:Uma2 family endonuclease